MTGCEHHNFAAFADVARLTAGDDGPISGFSLSLKVDCADCGEPFVFIAPLPVGVSPRQPTASLDASELRCPIRPLSAPEGWGEDGPAVTLHVRSAPDHGAN